MKALRRGLEIIVIFSIVVSFSSCASTQKTEKRTPINIGEIYYQDWVSEENRGDSGFNIFIPILSNSNNIVLDSIYFKNKQVKLEQKSNNLFVGRFKSFSNQKKDIIMSNEPYAEYGNKFPEFSRQSSFNLEENECIISYSYKEKVKYFKIKNIVKKKSVNHQ
ncbi:hypothetical protein [Algibacter aquimarinus]|uniref:Lipoprotein n=1 Tax=Algibacter aquimarinus TaxID=1136748 RepID=A0ABP9HCK5_9FLAO